MTTHRLSATSTAGPAVGVVVPYDFALDRELWRWVPKGANLMITRTPYAAVPVTVDQAMLVSDNHMVAACAQELLVPEPRVVAYGCTSGSFVGGLEGERSLVEAMLHAGAPAAVTTSGALVEALRHLGVRRLAVATPYDEAITLRLEAFLAEAGIEVTGVSSFGLSGQIWRVPYEETVALIRAAAVNSCDAVFVSCTNLMCYDLIAPMEAELGVPVITANQVTMWAAMARMGLKAKGPGQSLLGGRRRRKRTVSGLFGEMDGRG